MWSEEAKYNAKALEMLKQFKQQALVYRIISCNKQLIQLQQIYTGQTIQANTSVFLSYDHHNQANFEGTVVNPSLLKPVCTAKQYKEQTERFKGLLYTILPMQERDNNIDKTKLDMGKVIRYKDYRDRKVEYNKFFQQGLYKYVQNMDALKEYLISYYSVMNKTYAAEYIIHQFYNTFANNFNCSDVQTNGNKYKFAIQGEGNQNTVLFLEYTKEDYITLKGKRNNKTIDTKYNLKYLKQYITEEYLIVVIKMHWDTCMKLGITPFQYMLSPKYIRTFFKNPQQSRDTIMPIVANTQIKEIQRKDNQVMISLITNYSINNKIFKQITDKVYLKLVLMNKTILNSELSWLLANIDELDEELFDLQRKSNLFDKEAQKISISLYLIDYIKTLLEFGICLFWSNKQFCENPTFNPNEWITQKNAPGPVAEYQKRFNTALQKV